VAQRRSPNTSHWCWGYSFPWQTRTIIVPRGAPNLVCTVFVANALLDLYEHRRDSRCLDMAVSAAEYIIEVLCWSEGDRVYSMAYPLPTSRLITHNANLLGAALLCRVARLSGETRFVGPALRVARYSAGMQSADGSWPYGEQSTQQWIDNFHTGYNLSALRSIDRDVGSSEFEARVSAGFGFYRKHFFRDDGAPRYFHDRTYPIDIHCVAQSIISLVEFRDLDDGNIRLAETVLDWAMTNMRDDAGFFYYRVLRLMRVRIPYMRWSQAWMLLALSTLLEALHEAPGAGSMHH
jgi:hypothetical protein